jgi:hypothetical protein
MNTKSLKQYLGKIREYSNQKYEYNKKLNQMKIKGVTTERIDTAKVFGFRMIMRRFDLLMMGQRLWFASLFNRVLFGNLKTNSGVITKRTRKIRSDKGTKRRRGSSVRLLGGDRVE